MMRGNGVNPVAEVGEPVLVRGQRFLGADFADPRERVEEVRERIRRWLLEGVQADVGSDRRQYMVAGEQAIGVLEVEADVAR